MPEVRPHAGSAKAMLLIESSSTPKRRLSAPRRGDKINYVILFSPTD